MASESDAFKAELLKNPQIKADCDAPAPEYERIEHRPIGTKNLKGFAAKPLRFQSKTLEDSGENL